MKKLLITLTLGFWISMVQAFAHSENEIGPHGGRILEFSKNQSVHGEVVLTNGVFQVVLLDKDMKPMPLKEQSLVVTGGSRSDPQKPKIEKTADRFVFPKLAGETYLLVFQFKENSSAKAVTARFQYDAAKCGKCAKEEWLCDCGLKAKARAEGDKKKKQGHLK